MTNKQGYVYIRENPGLENKNICKLGQTMNIPERETTYITSEPDGGYFTHVFEITNQNIKHMNQYIRDIETHLKKIFNMYHYKSQNTKVGTEWYYKNIQNEIEEQLKIMQQKLKSPFTYKRLTQDEISELETLDRSNHETDDLESELTFENENTNKSTILPYEFQENIINKSLEYYKTPDNTKGLLILSCGMGKTNISLWIAQKLGAKLILIAVPGVILMEQWSDRIKSLIPDVPVYYYPECDISNIDLNGSFVLTTYSSAHNLLKNTTKFNIEFDFKILDECHHATTGNIDYANEHKSFINILHIKSKYQLAITATTKESYTETDKEIANDSEEWFGKEIERLCLLYAIKNNVVCNYDILAITADKNALVQQLEKYKITEQCHKQLFLSAYITLKSIISGHTNKLLMYCNSIENSKLIISYLNILITDKYFEFNPGDLYCSNYDSNMTAQTKTNIMNKFNTSKFSILSVIYCLGEGYDNKLIDGVVFSENMTSFIRILQAALRPCRKDVNNPTKIGKIILPVINLDNINENIRSLNQVRKVVYEMGIEDNTVIDKVKYFKIFPVSKCIKSSSNVIDKLGDYDEELKENIGLKTISRENLLFGYEQAKKILTGKNIKCRKDYLDLCLKDNRFPEYPDHYFKGKFTDWIDYLNINRRLFYDLNTCRTKIQEYTQIYNIKVNNVDLMETVSYLVNVDDRFPPSDLWIDMYGMELAKLFIQNSPNLFEVFYTFSHLKRRLFYPRYKHNLE